MSEILVNTIKKADGTGSITVPADSGTLLTSASTISASQVTESVPAFQAYRSSGDGNQTIPAATHTKMQMATEEFDFGGFYDATTNYRFQPTIAGYYYLGVSAKARAATNVNQAVLSIFKNGSMHSNIFQVDPASPYVYNKVQLHAGMMVYANGSTDYFEAYIYIDGSGDKYIEGGSTRSSGFYGYLVRAA